MKKMIFDFDGTLVDSMPSWGGKMLYVLNKYGVKYPSNIVETLTPLGDKGSAEYFIQELAIAQSKEKLIADMDEYAAPMYATSIPAKEGVCSTLQGLKAHGFTLCVLTASPHRLLDGCLKRVGLYDLFDEVWSCEDFGMTKSDTKIYKAVAKRLQTTVGNCVLFDDNIHALTTAKAAGFGIVGVYDESSHNKRAEITALCDRYVESFSQIDFKDYID